MMAPEDMICFSLYAAHQAMGRIYRPLLEPLGLTYPQYLVMLALWQRGDLPLKALSQTLSLESNTLTPLLKRLEAAGFLSRARNPKDERELVITLTEAGKALQTQAEHIPACIHGATGMGMTEIFALRDAIHQLEQALRQSSAPSKAPAER